jgi:hypothetical protein
MTELKISVEIKNSEGAYQQADKTIQLPVEFKSGSATIMLPENLRPEHFAPIAQRIVDLVAPVGK